MWLLYSKALLSTCALLLWWIDGSPNHVHVLICSTCEYVTLYVKNNFADEIWSQILNGDIILDDAGGLHVITRVII